ncbi:peptide chain release factor N(5)-glutamine methyltransferase [Actibacterium sp. 188UL27-1]|nr:peptide chain release factor N(5)-glutamine methyltransferase [Actibacterium sp. 188UL27-1]MBM7067481.1 peptide chain release factor N(5)-glutamine methyltransferase [Actibacterium sp. 188UL27-1]
MPGQQGNQVIATAVRWLRDAGVDDAPRDARILLAHALRISPAALTPRIHDTLTDAELKSYGSLIEQRRMRQPVAQIVGYRRFATRTFKVTPDVMDPRPETETLIELAKAEPYTNVLDLGVGSGAILLTLLADRRGQARGTGVDLTEEACAVAYANAQSTGVVEQADIFISDWFQYVEGQFDLIVSNPPYIAAQEMELLQPEVHDWEPHTALTDGVDGLTAYRRIAADLLTYLSPGGRFLCEIGPSQGAAVSEILSAAGLADVTVHTDIDGRDRVVAARHSTGSV